MSTFKDRARKAGEELVDVIAAVAEADAERLTEQVLRARRIACYGVGREGLVVKAFCMRLMHLGLAANMVGEMTTPPIGPGDVLVASAGPGHFSTVAALLDVAKAAGATTLVLTAQPLGECPRQADVVVHVPAQTMADDTVSTADQSESILPMGSLYEIALLVFLDVVTTVLRDRTGQNMADLRARHTNLE